MTRLIISTYSWLNLRYKVGHFSLKPEPHISVQITLNCLGFNCYRFEDLVSEVMMPLRRIRRNWIEYHIIINDRLYRNRVVTDAPKHDKCSRSTTVYLKPFASRPAPTASHTTRPVLAIKPLDC